MACPLLFSQVASALPPAPLEKIPHPSVPVQAHSPPSSPDALANMKLPDPFRDWTAVDYLVIVVVMVVCLANVLLR
jgi:hypothetical protein